MDPVLTTIFSLLAQNLWVGLFAILLYFVIKSSPKILEAFEKYLATKNEELNKIGKALESHESALDKIVQAIHSFEKALIAGVSDLKVHMDGNMAELKDEIRDQRIQELATFRQIGIESTAPPSSVSNVTGAVATGRHKKVS